MAVDTAAKRRAAAGVSTLIIPLPDGTIVAVERANLWHVYPAGATPPPPPLPEPGMATTPAEIVALVEAVDLEVDFGADLLDSADAFLLKLDDDLEACRVARNMFRTIHGTCSARIARNLQWQRHRIRPRITLTSRTEGLTKSWNMGVFLLSTPDQIIGETPETYEVEGWDKLILLDTPVGATYSMATGAAYLATIESILAALPAIGADAVHLDQTAAATVSTTDRVWLLTDKVTWLRIINDLLEAVGYRALYADRDGKFRSEPYTQPADRASTWAFNADSPTTSIVGERRVYSRDLTDVPNRWVFTRRNVDTPVDGDGRYEVLNQTDGPTSIDARDNRVVTALVETDAIDQDTLVNQVAPARVIADKDVAGKLEFETGIVPALWHSDVVDLTDSALGAPGRMVVEEWETDLTGATEMRHRWRQLVTA